ncbi:hypothetical protein PV327_009605 [Microctonus hyperodae]|uniref:OCEL domain-containing protein n=1 Tax=Microctonus hyperodae TaxID=165561 RepID=A0AA39CBM5_MICHY|nr:hypothetical protein PV327_009605 [Microctonus hyperodae]
MAALVAGVQYGLSSHSNFHENKSLIFVKLTDSAQRAIEDYLRNRNKTSQNPTIQFLGNEGQLSFPSSQHNHGSTGFTFSLSSNHDIEGPQGAFECVQQTGPKNLESLGTLPCKMRIQANDDVYETTRHRMAVAEENSKNKCTRVIKANGPDIGRKIKVKATGRTIPPSTSSSSSSSSLSSSSSTNVRHRESLSIPTTVSQSSRLHYNSNTSSTMSSSTISSSSSLASSSHKSMGTNGNPPSRMQQNKRMSELMRRPLKERLIHVLALRPYKKPELYDRITREGLKERDRSTMTTILKQVAYMHDNTYHLHLYIWNDIQEDWPFYSEQDRAMLKRRKPQNLTPPGSSDGSSGSGQSPNSMHPGSPPAIIAPPPSLINSKRPGYYQGNDGLQTKRPRISHYRKPESTRTSAGSYNSNSSTNNNTNTNSGYGLSGTAGPSSMITSNETANWEYQQQSRQYQRDRSDYRIEKIERNERTANSDVLHGSYTTIAKPCLTPTSDCDENVTTTTTTTTSTTTNINNYNNNNNNNGNRYANTSSSSASSSSTSAAAVSLTTTTLSSYNSSTSINSNNNLYNSGTTSTMRHNSNVFNGNDKVSSVVNSGNCDGVGVFDYMRSVGGNINKNINNNSVSVGGGGSSSSMNNGGNNRGFGASPCNSGVIEARRGNGDFRDGRNNDKERDGDRETRELNNKNFGSATDGIDSYKIKDSSANYGVCNNYNDNNEDDPSPVVAEIPAAPIIEPAESPIILAPASPSCSNSDDKTPEYPDYLTQYTAINNTEQRRSYKAEFNSDYEEYRKLHTRIAEVSQRFAELEEQRQRELEIGNSLKGLELKEQIVAEYITTRNDPAHIETKRRFHYLHEKLSHIKRLVLEYDTEHFGPAGDDMNNNGEDILGGNGDLQY